MKVIVWGTGYFAKEYVERKSYHVGDEIIAFTDNDSNLWGKTFKEKTILAPEYLEQIKFDRLIICSAHFAEIIKQIREELCINAEIITYFELEDQIKKQLISKYADVQDDGIQKVLAYYREHPLNIYGAFDQKGIETIYPVQYDADKMPYILFEEKKMFFPKSYPFVCDNNLVCIKNILYEQGEHSPHLYIKDKNILKKDMVIVDAGVCEGNFALRYADYAKKIYLIECDPEWSEVLQRTFQPYKDKVVFCQKYLSDKDSEQSVRLDTLIQEPIDILKMDIEGYEVRALKGAERVLRESSAYCAVCSYHKHQDERQIKALLQQYGYRVETSEGFMFFPYDDCLEFRKGVVYGRKNQANGEY